MRDGIVIIPDVGGLTITILLSVVDKSKTTGLSIDALTCI